MSNTRVDVAAFITEQEFPPLQHFINGAFVESAGEEYSEVVNPANGQVIALVPRGSTADVDDAVNAAHDAFRQWGSVTPKEGSEAMLAIANVVEENADLLARLEAHNAGKPLEVAGDDVDGTVDIFRFSAGAARAFTEAGAGDYVEDHTSFILREPLGVIGAIVPWNYPLLMGAWKIAPILAAGNTLVLKPAEQTPLSVLKLAELIAGVLPRGVFNVVTGLGREVGEALSHHEKIAMVAMTGSVGSGRAVASAASGTLKRVHLELGGKATVVVLKDAGSDAVAEGVREAGFWNSGQECGAGTRILVDKDVEAELVEKLVAQIGTLTVGDPAEGEHIEQCPLVSEQHFERAKGFLERAQNEGAVAALGGSAADREGFFIQPTVLTNVLPGTEAAQEEIFSPVITVETFETEEEAIERANDTPYGLSASVWTTDAARSIDVPRKIDAGTVWVNSHLVLANEVQWADSRAPATAATYRSTRYRTTPARSTSKSTTVDSGEHYRPWEKGRALSTA
ncbi:aldehyde dehydrogenase family protein [Corynebacterium casei]|uniref:aldehyde dehydrogenase family protein n=1 Tax=Corynebacterium casei TaxID=160386 RepID=UPI003F8E9450